MKKQQQHASYRIKEAREDRVTNIVIYIVVLIVMCITLYPMIYVFSMSFSDPMAAARGEVILLPKGFNLTAYKTVFSDKVIFTYFGNTIFYTFTGILFGVITTMLAAYPLSRRNFSRRKYVTLFITLTMFLYAGLIPNYIVVVKFLKLYDTRMAMVLPTLTSAWYVLVTKNYITSLPEELFDSAKVDGASEFGIFGRIVMPLSKPIIAVLSVYLGIGYWNTYFPSLLYQSKDELRPVSMYVRKLVVENSIDTLLKSAKAGAILTDATALLSRMQIKYAVIVVAMLPLMLLYPFFSKYLKKGMMVGSIKG